jgi:hypothetical protein
MFASGATEYGVEISFRGTLVADIATHSGIWNGILIEHEDKKGNEAAATALIKSHKEKLVSLIVAGRSFVDSILDEDAAAGIAEHDIKKDFGYEGDTPEGAADLIELGRQMATANARYIADSNPFALPAAPFIAIGAKAEELEVAIDSRKKIHLEAIHVGKLKDLERAKGDKLLSQAFNWVVAVWGDNDERLEAFGFVPKSQIWTEKKKAAPEKPVEPT